MDKVYVVRGSTGFFEDYEEWTVKAFSDPIKAQEHRDFLTGKYSEIKDRLLKKYGKDLNTVYITSDFGQKLKEGMREFDPKFWAMTLDVEYNIDEIPFQK